MGEELFYSPQIEYNLVMGYSQCEHDSSAILGRAKNIITEEQECSEDNNDYRKIMMLQKIVLLNQKMGKINLKTKPLRTYELKCFLPFIEYELSKEEDKINWRILLGLATNSYVDKH